MEKILVPAAPARLINAVARMGYDPEVALCDLIDNSIDAKANHVSVVINVSDDEERATSVSEYIIADDGVGMNRETLINAFQLGTQKTYDRHALGKFGIGLKSAGLSLGEQICVVTRTAGGSPICAVLTMADVEESGQYRIDLGEVEGEWMGYWSRYLPANASSGTVVVIRQLHENQPNAGPFVDYLNRHLGQVFHLFIQEDLLELSVNGHVVSPIDPLFAKEAREGGELSVHSWSGRTVHLLAEEQPLALTDTVSASFMLTHLVHPPSFSAEGLQATKRDAYLIEEDPYTKRQRHGFYIYRNRRVISVAERFHGLVPSQTAARAFRGRLMFDESADQVLSLDVKKRHCQLPPKARATLKMLVSTYVAKSSNAWKEAGERENLRRGDIKNDLANKSISTTPVVNLEYTTGVAPQSKEEVEARRDRQRAVEREARENVQDKAATAEVIREKVQKNESVTLVDGIRGNAMWISYPSVELGKAATVVNRQHSWVANAYAAAETEPGIAIVLHQLFTILARAELEMRSSLWPGVSEDAVDKTLKLFQRRVSTIGEDLAEQLAQAIMSVEGSSSE